MTTDIAVQEPHDLAVADREQAAGALAHILATGDLAKLTNEQRVAYYLDYCSSLSLNPRSRPFDWLVLDGRLVLYPNKSCAEQLRRQHQISVKVTRREVVGDLFVCEVQGRRPNGVTDESSKYVSLKDSRGNKLVGTNLANAFAKAETGAKRRLVLSMVGLASPPDPEEVKGAKFVVVDGTGRIIDNPTQEQRYLAQTPAAARAIGAPVYEDHGGQESPLAGTPDQRVTSAEVAPPQPAQGQRPSFRASDEDVRRWLGAWFAVVKGTSLDDDEARHQYVEQWTRDELAWPAGKWTTSARTMFARMTEREAGDFLAHVRAICDDERRSYLDESEEGHFSEDVDDDDVALSDASSMTPIELPDEPDWLRADERPLMLKAWSDWAGVLKRLDPDRQIKDATKLQTRALVAELRNMIVHARSVHEARESTPDEAPEEPQSDPAF